VSLHLTLLVKLHLKLPLQLGLHLTLTLTCVGMASLGGKALDNKALAATGFPHHNQGPMLLGHCPLYIVMHLLQAGFDRQRSENFDRIAQESGELIYGPRRHIA